MFSRLPYFHKRWKLANTHNNMWNSILIREKLSIGWSCLWVIQAILPDFELDVHMFRALSSRHEKRSLDEIIQFDSKSSTDNRIILTSFQVKAFCILRSHYTNYQQLPADVVSMPPTFHSAVNYGPHHCDTGWMVYSF